MISFLGRHPLHTTFLRFSNLQCSPKPKSCSLLTYAGVPARDRVIDFGKYKGRMLGTLPSTYLKWVSNNLRARDFEEWAQLADQVLEDPVYNDRVEWEHAEKLLNGNVLTANSKSEDAVSELLELSQRFGWDNENKVGWTKIDFQLLGTSKGGRIPRVKENEGKKSANYAEDSKRWEASSSRDSRKEVGVSVRRVERRERMKMKRGVSGNKNPRFYGAVEHEERKYDKNAVGNSDDGNEQVYNPFPGRETLLGKVLNRSKII